MLVEPRVASRKSSSRAFSRSAEVKYPANGDSDPPAASPRAGRTSAWLRWKGLPLRPRAVPDRMPEKRAWKAASARRSNMSPHSAEEGEASAMRDSMAGPTSDPSSAGEEEAASAASSVAEMRDGNARRVPMGEGERGGGGE